MPTVEQLLNMGLAPLLIVAVAVLWRRLGEKDKENRELLDRYHDTLGESVKTMAVISERLNARKDQ